ncbi:alkaline phosphatase [Acinetobacter rathckeae]|uniref:alkaline phosphatase n=1 Tax=Acinetobacter rathckeae TaxID=2605272 RepID=UPI0018A26D53|nr:alkaline phosphatase [Acinetobacter rathckeae]MBF7689033.1 alkaline phosphatase [Acinetobacter rathckeae]MBF7696553.1 alkaline phosphatase [Acinetobacter rathckeae]
MQKKHQLFALSILSLSLLLVGCGQQHLVSQNTTKPVAKPKNIIVLINDGAGVGTWDATANWQYGGREKTPYANFPAKYAMTTYPLNTSKSPTNNSDSVVNYDPQQAWDTTPTQSEKLAVKGYEYLSKNPTDSAAAGTALASGKKTFNNAINYDNYGNPVDFITLTAKKEGKATGVITTVPFSHATPAAFGAQNISRNNYHAISNQMLSQGHLDLVMGTGAPGYNVNGTPCEALASNESKVGCDEKTRSTYLSSEDWNKLTKGQLVAKNNAFAWNIIRDKQDFEALANGSKVYTGPIFASPKIANTLQQARQVAIVGKDGKNPSGDAYVKTVPTLSVMTKGAINHLSKNPNGFFLMVEGGATDWSAHTSSCSSQWNYGTCTNEPEYGRLMEETKDFNDAVKATIDWVEKNSNWNETLVIVTTDHDNGMPMGADANTKPFQLIENKGKGNLPKFSFRPTGDHSNALVPLWAKGAGSERFAHQVKGIDKGYAKYTKMNDGRYIDNTDVFNVIDQALTK